MLFTRFSIDPVGGALYEKLQTIVNELHGEKIDIIKWTEDLPAVISESLSPAEIQKVLQIKIIKE